MLPVICVIPSRYGAQRFPGKPLVDLLGKPMIQWVWEAARTIRGVDEILVATDDDRIRSVVEGFGGKAVMTPSSCPSGSDRIALALEGRECRAVINLQGDEPLMNPQTVEKALTSLLEDPQASVSTACIAIRDRVVFENPMVVKVVRGRGDIALYFSRSPIPSPARLGPERIQTPGFVWGYKHLGLYIYRPEALREFVTLPPSRLEQIESLEQLRFLESGVRILCIETDYDSCGVDTPEDLVRISEKLRDQK